MRRLNRAGDGFGARVQRTYEVARVHDLLDAADVLVEACQHLMSLLRTFGLDVAAVFLGNLRLAQVNLHLVHALGIYLCEQEVMHGLAKGQMLPQHKEDHRLIALITCQAYQLVDVLVHQLEVYPGTMESNVLSVEVHRVFATGHLQWDVWQRGN